MSTTVTVFIAIFIISALITVKYIQAKKSSALKDLLRRAGSEKVILMQQNIKCFGLEPHDGGLLYRSGHLMLTERHLLFYMWLPRWSLVIPLERVLHAEKSNPGDNLYLKLMLGNKDLLRLEYINEQRNTESATWIIKNADRWIEELGV